MKIFTRPFLFVLAALWAVGASAQTADEIIEKHLTAIGGRAALSKLQTRVATGTIAISAQGADLAGPITLYNKAPNKARRYFTLDLSQFGAGEMVVDLRCDGKTAFQSNNLQGDRELTGRQLQDMLNGTFPTPLLAYKEAGAKAELTGKEKVEARDAFVVLFTPKAGSPSKLFFDAETYLLLRTVVRADVPEAGGELESTTDVSDYRQVDGIKVPFVIKVVNSLQAITMTLAKVEHNTPIEDAMFARPPVK
jgi:outer membrane lipoprotein-sorting protein